MNRLPLPRKTWKEIVWDTPEWKTNRAKILQTRDKCEWCGSKHDLRIHHPPKLIDRKELFDKVHTTFKKSYKGLPEHEPMAFVTWLNKTGKRRGIKNAAMAGTNRQEYIDMVDVIVLCEKCHDKIHRKLIQSHRDRRLSESTPNSSQSDRSSKDVNGAERD